MYANEGKTMNKKQKTNKRENKKEIIAEKDDKSMLDFLKLSLELKKLKRTGWVDRKINNPESVADHSYQVALMALVFGKKLGIDVNKAVKMALIHDLPEAIVGDISVDQRHNYKNSLGIKPTITNEEKKEKEEQAMKEILKLLDKKTAKEIHELSKEYEERKTKTARIVKELDSLEVILQALEYQKENIENKNIEDFFLYRTTFNPIQNKTLQKDVKLILEEKEKIKKSI